MSEAHDFAYVLDSKQDVRSAVVSIWKAATDAGWTVVGDYDLSGLMSAGDEPSDVDMKSIDICQPDLAYPFLKNETLAALLMPCNVLIYKNGDGTKIAAMRPSVIMPKLFDGIDHDLADIPVKIDEELRKILESGQ